MRGFRLFVRQMRGTLLVLVSVLAVAAAVIEIGHLSARGTHQTETFHPGKVQTVSDSTSIYVRPADHRQINRLVKAFVADAVARRNPVAAYSLASPDLRAAATRRQWQAGDIPVLPYPADLRTVQPTVSYVYPRRVGLDLVLQPRPGAHAGGMAFAVEVKRVGPRWLVDSIAPVQGFGGPSDGSKKAAGRTETVPVLPEKGNVGVAWIVTLAIVTPLALILGTLLFLGLRGRFSRRGELPPPPRPGMQ